MNRKTDVGGGPAALLELRERVRAATGPSDEIDDDLMALIYVRDKRRIGEQENSGPGGSWVHVKTEVWIDPTTDKWVGTHARRYTSSIDESLALCERVLPDWQIDTLGEWDSPMLRQKGPWTCVLVPRVNRRSILKQSIAPRSPNAATAPLAIVEATLSALIEQARSADSTPPLTTGGE